VTPAITALRKHKISFEIVEYEHDPAATSYGQEAADATGTDPAFIFKTLMVMVDGKRPAVAVVPVDKQLDLKAIAAAAQGKKAAMAAQDEAERRTGYVVGGISPIGQKKLFPTFIDQSAESLSTMYVSGGRRGLEVCLAPHDLLGILDAQFVALATSE